MNKALHILILGLLLTLGACDSGPGEAPLAGASIGGPFTLTDQNGARVSDTQFAGSYRLIYFGYTMCPDVCPVDVQRLAQGLKLLERQDPVAAAKVQPIFITVDPARDTPAVLKSFVAAFHPRLIGLTGSEAEIAAVAKRFGIYYRKAETSGMAGYLVDHGRQAILFGPQGEPIALIPQDGSAEAIAAELGKWVR